jgi:hypothetical protein
MFSMLNSSRSRISRAWATGRGGAALTAPPPQDAAQEAEAVRDLAYTYRNTEPRFAAELYAAAERHEQTGRFAA